MNIIGVGFHKVLNPIKFVNMAVLYILYALELKLWLKKQSSFKFFLIRNSHCLAPITFILL